MKKVKILLWWMLLGVWAKSSGRLCTISILNQSSVQLLLECSTDICESNRCRVTNQSGTTCQFSFQGIAECQEMACPDVYSLCHLCPLHNDPNLQDTFLNRVVKNPIFLCNFNHYQVSCPSSLHNQQCTNPSSTALDTITISASLTTNISSIATRSQTRAVDQSGENTASITLGIFVCVLLVLLIVVTSGWVWTYWTTKQKERNGTNLEQVRTVHNTAYGITGPINNPATDHIFSRNSEHPNTTADKRGFQDRTIENSFYLIGNDMEEEGGEEHKYHVLEGPGGDEHVHQNRELEMTEIKESGEEHEYHVLEGQGGDQYVHQNRELEMREVKESGEEHEYHVLEGPGCDDASRELEQREVGGAMDYEIPQPLKNE